MRIVYASLTGNVRRLAAKLDANAIDHTSVAHVGEPFVFITYTIGFGDVPAGVFAWLDANRNNLRGIVASGNRNWGANFAKAGDTLAERYNTPLLRKVELAGTPADITAIQERMRLLDENNA